MNEYICTKSFFINEYDDDGFFTENVCNIEAGTPFTVSDSPHRIAGGPETVRLEGSGVWLEISKETLHEYFTQSREENR